MGVTKVETYKEMYKGSMTVEDADRIIAIRNSEDIPEMRHLIYNFPSELVVQSIQEGVSIREILRRDNLNAMDYLGSLRGYQTLGTAFMIFSPRSIIGDGVGLGKTAEIAALINFLKLRPFNEFTTKLKENPLFNLRRFLIAVETSALNQTQHELVKFTGLRIVVLPSEAVKMKRVIKKTDWNTVDGIVIKHSALRSDVLYTWLSQGIRPDGTLSLFDTFFLDESSVIKNLKTRTARYTQTICSRCRRIHFMNATVFETNILDIYNQIDMMNPTLMPKKSRIEREFCTWGTSQYWKKEDGKPVMKFRRDLTGYKNQGIFKEKLRLVYFARCKADVGMDMPHVHKVYEVSPSSAQLEALNEGYRYMEVLNCPSLIPEINMATDRKSVPKLDRLMNLLETELADSKVMVYCFHTEAQVAIAEECAKIGKRAAILNGDTKDDERFRIQLDFNEGKYDVIITNIMKSLNLFGGDACIFYSNSITPSKMFQVAGRVDRNVDDKIKTFILLIYKDTDEYRHFMEVTKQRAQDSRDLTIDAKTTVDFFIEAMRMEEAKDLGIGT